MTPLKRNLSRLIFIILVLLVGSVIFGVIYFLKMERNEDVLNTLYFRELQQIEGTIARTLQKVEKTSDYSLPNKFNIENVELKDVEKKSTSAIRSLSTSANELRDLQVLDVSVEVGFEDKYKNRYEIEKTNSQFAFFIPSYDKAIFEQSVYYGANTKLKLTLQSSIQYVLSQRLNRFQTVALVEDSGEVKSVVNNATKLVNDPELFFKDIGNLVPELYANGSEKNIDEAVSDRVRLSGTRYNDVQFDDTTYRIYLHPLTSKGKSVEGKYYYLVGAVKKKLITSQKLKLPPDMLMWLILALLFLIAIIPLLKLRFISETYSIQPGDKSQIVLGLIVAVGIVTIGLSQQLFQDYLIEVKEKQLKTIYRDMRQDVTKEVKQVLGITRRLAIAREQPTEEHPLLGPLTYKKNNLKSWGEFLRDKYNYIPEQYLLIPALNIVNAYGFLGTCFNHNKIIDRTKKEKIKPDIKLENTVYTSFLSTQLLGNSVEGRKNCSFLEALSSLGADGKVVKDKLTPFLYLSEKLVNTSLLDLSDREYFKAAMREEYWSMKLDGIDMQNVFMERIFNIEDGRRNLMFTIPPIKRSHEEIESGQDEVKMHFAGTRLSSLVDRILPKHFGFAVIDEQGDVIFHSDDSLSLVENFFIETSQNALLRAATTSISNQSVPVNLEYKGVPHKAVVGSLLEPSASNNAPWHLVVFFDPTELQTINMVMVFTTVFIFLLTIIPGFIIFRYLTIQRFWQDLCYYNRHKQMCYLGGTILTFATGLFIISLMGIVVSLVGRLLLWSVMSAVLASLVIYCWQLRYNMYYWWRQPLIAFTGLCIPVLLAVFISWREFYTIIPENQISALIGIVLLISACSILLKRSQCKLWESPLINFLCAKLLLSLCLLALTIIFLFRSWQFGIVICLGLVLWWVISRKNKNASRPESTFSREKTRFSTSYVWFLASLFYFAGSVPASIITFSAHDYLLSRQAQFEEQALKSEISKKDEVFASYIRFLTGDACETQTMTGRIAYSKEKSLCDISLGNTFKSLANKFYALGSVAESRKRPDWVQIQNEATNYKGNSTDRLFNYLFGAMLGETEFISQLTLAAKKDLMKTDQPFISQLRYRADLFLIEPLTTSGGVMIVTLMFLGVPFGLYLTVRQLIVRRLMGEHILDQYRLGDLDRGEFSYPSEFPQLNFHKLKIDGHSQLILNATRLKGEMELLRNSEKNNSYVLFERKVFRIVDCLDKFYSTDEHANVFYFSERIKKCVGKSVGKHMVVAVSALEQLSLNPEAKKDALDLLFELHLNKQVLLVIVSETAPLYRMLNPNAYQYGSVAEVNIDEKTEWATLFSEFDKYYAWSPVHKSLPLNPFDVNELLSYECAAWPEITSVLPQFDSERLREPEQIIEFMLVHAGPLYRRKWEECTIKEKIILWRMAHGATINPQSAVTIERLVRRCYLYRDKGWHLINESFRQFVLTAEPESVMKSWMDNTSTGVWSIIRIPIFAILLVLMAAFIYSSGSSLDSLLGIATAALGLIPLMIKNLSLLKGGGSDIE
ncbi:hypothetical protein [Alteromonas confluentis]|uniref:Cache domain-containing protein n=1 Tax=Alteromonas confluentis TaxID=1656094 RepID=A0A1E7ZEJ0_9ALTE|nr:hypothetical protein [Alteromonas confluentis]OFC71935.1 hypothetical protein BFC18_05705 [Alteromonas confluentis]